MSKAEQYREILSTLESWDAYLLAESGLPGPRGNLELAHVVADMGDAALFERLLTNDPESAPTNSPEEFLAFCGVEGLGKLAAQGQTDLIARIRTYASDPRWRLREAVAMALQRVGRMDMPLLIEHMRQWSTGSCLEKRAVAAALCEPDLLNDAASAKQTLDILDTITASIADITDRRSEDFKALRKGLAYCWSVAVAALPEAGKPLFEKWLASEDKDILWIIKQNLGKARLKRMDAAWVERCLQQIV